MPTLPARSSTTSTDIRDVLERASARETAARVAVGALARQLLAQFGIEVMSHVTLIGGVGIDESLAIPVDRIRAIPDDSPLRLRRSRVEQAMIAAIDRAKEAGDTLGGASRSSSTGLPVGLGSYVQWDRKLDGRLAQAIMSIPAIKAVGIGKGPEVARLPGSRIHDEIVPAPAGRHRPSGRRRGAADQQRGRPRGRRHQRRAAARQRLHEADRDADEAAAIGGPHDAGGIAGRHRTQRRLRCHRSSRRRRGDGEPGARGRLSREVHGGQPRRDLARRRGHVRGRARAIRRRRGLHAAGA